MVVADRKWFFIIRDSVPLYDRKLIAKVGRERVLSIVQELNKVWNFYVGEVDTNHQYQLMMMIAVYLLSNPRIDKNDLARNPNKNISNELVKSRDDGCVFCKTKSDLTIHHQVHRCCGGGNLPTNLYTLCQDCHHILHDIKNHQSGESTMEYRASVLKIKHTGLKF
jgi:hypothetical protein